MRVGVQTLLLAAAAVVCVATADSKTLPNIKAAPTEQLVHLVTPGRDIECLMVDPTILVYGNVQCGIHRNRFRGSQGSSFGMEKPSRRWLVNATQYAVVDMSNRPIGSSPARVLRYGQALKVGYFRCTSRVAGLTCLSRHSGHGFFLSNKRQRTF